MTLVREVIPPDAVLERLRFEPGDIAVVRLAHEPSHDELAYLGKALREVIPDETQGLLLVGEDASLEELELEELEALLAAREATRGL